jgi:division protein CdvB (Snf7/Vps24/ESCRT-III family)
MRYYNDPTIKDVMTEIETIQKQMEELRPKLITPEHVAEAVGWASLKVDIAKIKEALQGIDNRLKRAGL